MKKRLLALLMAGAMCFSLAACGNTGSTNSPSPGSNSSAPQGGGDSAELTIGDVWPSGTTVYVDVPAKAGAPYHNLKELGDYIKDHPGDLVVGCALGGTSQIILYNIIASLGEGYADMVNYVQCSSDADKLTQTASGSIDIANCSIPNAQAYEADGKLTILGTVGPKVATLETMSKLVGLDLPETFKSTLEQDINFSWDAGYYVLAPKGTPDNVCKAINDVLVQLDDNQGFQEGMSAMASYINTADLATARADWAREWQEQIGYLDALGLLARDVK